jgi:putative FmdB family regulatory protein
MPLFEYRCTGCDSRFELLIRGGATPTCPSCGSVALERELSMFAVSSDGTRQRSAEKFGAKQREQSKKVSQEREHDDHDDHHHTH